MEPLKDPLNDRHVSHLPLPPQRPLPIDILIKPFSNLPCWKFLKDHLTQEGKLTKSSAIFLISQARFMFESESNVIELFDPVTIVGDIHGQFYDLLKILEIGGNPEDNKYLFLGDYVDRGHFSLEIIFLMYALKINFPKTFFMLRGNHETRQMTSHHNFRKEVLYKYDLETYELIMESFDAMPLVCVINGKFLSVHGGISGRLDELNDILKINRFVEPPHDGLYCDLLWSDPIDNMSGDLPEKFVHNENRSCSCIYGLKAANSFLKGNGLISIIRAHEVQMEGYKMYKWNGQQKFPTVMTIFSAPNYCGTYKNKGAVLRLDDSTINILQINRSQEPFVLPSHQNLFTWSVPFIIERTLSMLEFILKNNDENENTPSEENNYIEQMFEEMHDHRKATLASKIRYASKMASKVKEMKEKNRLTHKSRESSDEDRYVEEFGIEKAIEMFEKMKDRDKENEKRPQI
ncbi:hypothetical protein SteCoe_33996 [Stentor coeruleus]|uniref:Serine/threonine-protein phosphatase n=1 Tax=Stentor coeruleus TaxID=5963 RepID=A0A1R2AVH7_9CILI|nr:hypothetical protein SteCoe_33996 [Stentor coeruleus]